MTSRKIIFLSAGAAALLSAVPFTAFAADTTTVAETAAAAAATDTADIAPSVDDVVVTARHRAEDVQDVPSAITAIGGATLAKADQIHTANDITAFVPNASASATDGRTRPRWFLRGVGTNDTGANTVSPIGIYNDDVYLNNVYVQGFPLFDIDHVEVLRGPQGTLWGKNTTGGAVNIVSRQPDLNDFGGWAKFGAGSFSSRLAQGAINAPLIDDKLAVRLAVSHDEREGYVTNLYDGGKRGAYKDDAARFLAKLQATDDVDITLNLHARRLRGDKRVSNYFPDLLQAGPYNNGYADPPGRDTINQADAHAVENLDSKGGGLTLNWKLGEYTLTAIAATEHGERLLTGGAAIPVPNAVTYATSDSNQKSLEVRLASPKSDRFNWLVGGYAFDESLGAASTDGVNTVIPTTTAGYKPLAWHSTPYNQSTEALAAFASGGFNVTDNFTINGGLRFSQEKKAMTLNDYTAKGPVTFNDALHWWLPTSVNTPITTNYSGHQSGSWHELTYDITPQYKFNENANAYFRFAHGYRPGGFAVSGQNTINKIDPEVLNAYEAGVKTEWFDRKLSLNAAAFYYDYSQIQVLVFAQVAGSPDPIATLQNAGAGWVKGVELEANARPIEGLHLNASVGLLRTKYTQFNTVVNNLPADASGNEFARAPHLTASLAADYTFPAFNGQITVGGDWSYRTRQFYNAAIQNNPLLEQKAYALGNLRASYKPDGHDVEFGVSVSNVADLDYSVLATGPTTKAVRRVSGDPRIVMATVTTHF